MLINVIVVLLTVIIMEMVATLSHKYIMHGWSWHRSHHYPHSGWFEQNDLYAVVFATVAIALIAAGHSGIWPLQWLGTGITVYGGLYFVVHDGLVHQRWPFNYIPRRGYLKRLYMAHRLHHAVRNKTGCVSFGFLYAQPLSELQTALSKSHRRHVDADAAIDPEDVIAPSCNMRSTHKTRR